MQRKTYGHEKCPYGTYHDGTYRDRMYSRRDVLTTGCTHDGMYSRRDVLTTGCTHYGTYQMPRAWSSQSPTTMWGRARMQTNTV